MLPAIPTFTNHALHGYMTDNNSNTLLKHMPKQPID
jgi:hypothetical protein